MVIDSKGQACPLNASSSLILWYEAFGSLFYFLRYKMYGWSDS